MYYVAYGNNLHLKDMKRRCPDACVVGSAILKNTMLVFRGTNGESWLNVEPSENEHVPVGIWQIKPSDEASMDIYEAYPDLYDKKMITVQLKDKTVKAMIYIMNEGYPEAIPSHTYLETCMEGYRDFGFDVDILQKAYDHTRTTSH